MSLAANTTAAINVHSAENGVTIDSYSADRTFWLSGQFRSAAPALFALVLFLLGLLIYNPLLPGNFIMDDLKLVQWDNPIVNGTAGPESIWFRADFPLSTLGFWFEWKAWGADPLGYHLVNVTLHALGSFMLWLVLMRLRIRGAWLAAMLYMVHPVCLGTVARIAELKNTLSLPFFLLSLWAYLGYESKRLYPWMSTNEDSTRKGLWLRGSRPDVATGYYVLSVTAFVLALLAKTSVIMLPVILLCCAAWQRNRVTIKDLAHTAPHFALSLGFGLMSAWFQKSQALGGDTLAAHSLWFKLGTAARVSCFYLQKAFWPANLNIIYPRWDGSGTPNWGAWACVLGLITFAALAWISRARGGRHAIFALCSFLAILFPAMGFFDAQFLRNWQVSDHLQYAAILVPIAAGAAAICYLLPMRFAGAGLIGVTTVLALASHERCKLFRSEEALLRDALHKNPSAWAAHNDLGCLVAQQKKIQEAIAHFERSLRHDPDFPDAHLNLGQALLCVERPAEAESHFAAVLRHNPAHAEAHRGTARILISRNCRREAMLHFRAALKSKPDAQTHVDLAAILYQSGDRANAAVELRHALNLNRDHMEALNDLAWLLATAPDAQARNGVEAVECARRACVLSEIKQARPLGTLAAAYAEAGRFEIAIRTAQKAISAANALGDRQFASILAQLLDLYKRGVAYHEPARHPALSSTFPNGQ